MLESVPTPDNHTKIWGHRWYQWPFCIQQNSLSTKFVVKKFRLFWVLRLQLIDYASKAQKWELQ